MRFSLLDIQIRLSGSGYVNTFKWNREWFLSRRVKFDSRFNVMAVYEASRHGACVLRAPPGSDRPVLRRTPGRTPFHPCAVSPRPASRTHPLPTTPFQCTRSRTATLGKGGAAHLPALTLAWLYIEPSPRGGIRPAGDPVDSDPGAVFEDDPHTRSDAGRPQEPWVCHHTREPTVLSRLSCRPPHLIFLTVFTSLACSPRRTSRVGEDCRPRITWRPLTLAGSPALPPLLLTGGLSTPTRRYHGKMLIHPSSLRVPPAMQKSSHTRRFGTLASPPPPVIDMPWGAHPPGHPLHCFRGKLWTNTYLGLEPYLPASKSCWYRKLVKCVDQKSAVVVGLPHNSLKNLLDWRWLNLLLAVQTGISDLDFVLVFHFSPL